MDSTPKRRGRPPAPAKPVVRRWEYCQIEGYNEREPTLNEMGAQGWELVTIFTYDEPMRAPVGYAVFKREIA